MKTGTLRIYGIPAQKVRRVGFIAAFEEIVMYRLTTPVIYLVIDQNVSRVYHGMVRTQEVVLCDIPTGSGQDLNWCG